MWVPGAPQPALPPSPPGPSTFPCQAIGLPGQSRFWRPGSPRLSAAGPPTPRPEPLMPALPLCALTRPNSPTRTNRPRRGLARKHPIPGPLGFRDTVLPSPALKQPLPLACPLRAQARLTGLRSGSGCTWGRVCVCVNACVRDLPAGLLFASSAARQTISQDKARWNLDLALEDRKGTAGVFVCVGVGVTVVSLGFACPAATSPLPDTHPNQTVQSKRQ